MGDRPSYRPWSWGRRWPLVARWVKDRPDRVIAWYGGSLLATVGVLVVAALTSATKLIVVAGVALVIGAIEASVYVPRARRVIRERGVRRN